MIIALESSCDETALALFDPGYGLRGEWVYSQIELHGEYGGVVPDLASREHVRRFAPMLREVWQQCPPENLRAVAVTEGPGLAACLAVGIATAEAIGLALNLPVSGVNHLRGHAWSPFIGLHKTRPEDFHARLGQYLPHLGLLVSGGNTLLFQLDSRLQLQVLAKTADDAAGEALDKGAKLLGLGYPGGPLVEAMGKNGNAQAHDFPTGLNDPGDMRFSFSGIKTSLRYRIEKMPDSELEAQLADLCASYQAAVIAQLTMKTRHALRNRSYRSIGLSGGVARNNALRQAFARLAETQNLPLFTAAPEHSGDNAGMIAFAAWMDTQGTQNTQLKSPQLNPSLGLA